MPAPTCAFCAIIARRADALIIDEDDQVISFVPLRPEVAGHTLVVPKAHFADLYDIPDDVLAAVFAACKAHAVRWREQLGATGVNFLHASGVDAEQSVFHFHVHLLPRFPGDGVHAWPALPGSPQSRDDLHAAFRVTSASRRT